MINTEKILKFKYEGTFKDIFMLTKKHYIGHLIKPNGEEKKVIKGIEVLRSDASKFQELFQESLLDKILAKESKEQIEKWIELEKERFKTLPLTDISFPVKLSKDRESYKTEGIHVRALRYAQESNPDWQVRIGQDYYYCFIIPKGQETRIANRKVKGKVKEMVERNIDKKVRTIFEAMGW